MHPCVHTAYELSGILVYTFYGASLRAQGVLAGIRITLFAKESFMIQMRIRGFTEYPRAICPFDLPLSCLHPEILPSTKTHY